MPTVLRVGPYRCFFYSGDRGEPMHIHVERDDNVVKYWLDPVRLQTSGGFGSAELRRIQRIIENNRETLIEAWYEYFGE
ncbi:MAG: DUF4160 domain-containing protein [Gammaproteobacteria bacterium]|nr:DUF4160 domain-containing protein [Gammaproteobacteria bacterium]